MEEKVVGPKGQLRPKNLFKSMEMSLGVLTGVWQKKRKFSVTY